MEEGVNWMDSFGDARRMWTKISCSHSLQEHARIKVYQKVNNTTFDEVINKLDLGNIIYQVC